ncbi:efflux RND transporter periplasmic adaptor subunit [Fodinicurvata fenggangensis]|uniref:efflux RND transporter periplasmic adaptor subunit n=1 Tax=Fodinicurvata fenggangensis TaxID=1121830 RepID=UPI00047CE603|nr:efflux RND transporter periplasmic adaptor subunit [Fodinicurvata fenggangensis]
MNRSYLLAAGIALAAATWIAVGTILQGTEEREPEKEAAAISQSTEVQRVQVRTQMARPYVEEVRTTGHSEANRTVNLRVEQSGPVEDLPVSKGNLVEEGETILRIAEQDLGASLTEARARAAQRRMEYQASESLKNQGFRAETQFAEARAAYDQALAAERRAEIQIEQLTLEAPFDGVLETRDVEQGDYVDLGQEVAQVIDLDPVIIVAMLNEQQRPGLLTGGPGTARLPDGRELDGRIRYLASSANQDTRSFRVELEVENPEHSIPAGITAELFLPRRTVNAHRISPAILTLTDEGLLGVRAVEDGKVVFHEVEIAQQDSDGAWITGLPEEVTLITVGQEFVRDGQEVIPVPEEDPATSSTNAPDEPRT